MDHDEYEDEGHGKILSHQERKQLAIETVQLLHKHGVNNTADLLDYGLNNLISIIGNVILSTSKEKQVQTMFLLHKTVMKLLDQGIQEVFSSILNKTGRGLEATAINASTGETKTIPMDSFPGSTEEAQALFKEEMEEPSEESMKQASKIAEDFLEKLSKNGKLN